MNIECGKTLIIIGAVLIGCGILLVAIGKFPFFGKLPGDIFIEKKNFSFYFPLTTSIIVSIVLSLVFWFFSRR